MLFACLWFIAGCGASGSAEEEAAQETESNAVAADPMVKVMQNVQPDCVVLIDSLKVISPAQWEEWEL